MARSYAFADLWELVAEQVPEREAVVCGDRRVTYAELDERANRLANHLKDHGVGAGDHVGLYLTNSAEYLEVLLGAYKLRAVPINVNYRYVEKELQYLFDDAGVKAVVYDAEFEDRMAAIRDGLPDLEVELSLGPDYEAALAAADPVLDVGDRSSDDLYILYTGGTTGMPKGVVWRQEDAFHSCIGGGDPMRLEGPITTPEQIVERILPPETATVFLPVAPLMHAAGQWTSLSYLFCGGKVVLLPGSLDPDQVWRTIGDEGVHLITIVGDAVARPLLDAWDEVGGYDVPSLFAVGSGGAPLSPTLRKRLQAALPNSILNDGFGSSETGAQGTARMVGDAEGKPAFALMDDTTVVLDEAMRPIPAGSEDVGRVARTGHIPLRYHGDPEKSAATFVEVDGRRWVITGDMATVAEDGTINLLGRGSGCINTGGEKVFPEEVEAVLRERDDVYDVLVVGAPDERWGERVAAIVQPTDGSVPSAEELIAHCRGHLAGYKVPKSVSFVDAVVRSPAGKPDYRWAKEVVTAG
jgi:acyl-CoA synthetase (AMP-forming)/AMP-acid ligase II